MALKVTGISKRYGDRIALANMSLSVERGQIFGFVGPNGAGKTTTMRIIVGLLDPDSGEVTWDGEPIDTNHRRQIGYMPEERGLYPKMRVDQQLEYFGELHGLSAELSRRRTAEWLERLGVAERAEDNVEELSLGNQQRVQLAASLIFDPDLLVLDEPFSGLDPIGVDVLSAVLADVCAERNVPVIFSSHQLELVERVCDAVAIIKDGSLVAAGTVEDLERQNSQNLWKARIEGVDPGWDPGIEGVARQDPWIFKLDPKTDPQALLSRASATGPVVEFGEIQPGLAELFRTSIGDDR